MASNQSKPPQDDGSQEDSHTMGRTEVGSEVGANGSTKDPAPASVQDAASTTANDTATTLAPLQEQQPITSLERTEEWVMGQANDHVPSLGQEPRTNEAVRDAIHDVEKKVQGKKE